MKHLKDYRLFDSIQEDIIIANIRYGDDPKELKPLTSDNIKYVKHHGDFKTAYYELDYSYVDEFGYAPLGREIPESFFQSKNVSYINTEYYNKYINK
jgi:hypothetical protein